MVCVGDDPALFQVYHLSVPRLSIYIPESDNCIVYIATPPKKILLSRIGSKAFLINQRDILRVNYVKIRFAGLK